MAAVLGVALVIGLAPAARAGTGSDLRGARERLHALEGEIRRARTELARRQRQLRESQGRLNEIAARIGEAQATFGRIQSEVFVVREHLARIRARHAALRSRLDLRARQAYESGFAGTFAFLLDSSTLTDLSDRMEFLDRISESDVRLADLVQGQADELAEKQRALDSLLARQARALGELQSQQAVLDAEFAAQQALYDRQRTQLEDLAAKQGELTGLIDRLERRLRAQELARARRLARAGGPAYDGPGPFRYCPVQGPHAFGDSFGAPRYAGGYHQHAGNDLLAPRGTPIVAPFDGDAERHPNGLGGNAVIVRGTEGWVYNAHLDSYGATGRVTAGTVIGYVGDTGDARGGPTHDHFEWHPDVIPAHPWESPYGATVIDGATDPYPFLLKVC